MTLLIGPVVISATLLAPFFSIRFTQQAFAQGVNMTASDRKQLVITKYNQGTDLLNNGNYRGASELYASATDLINTDHIDPSYAALWHNYGVALDKLGQYQEALNSYNKAINIEPNNARHWDSKGTSLYHLHRYSEALDSYNKALSMDPTNSQFQKNKDIAQGKIGSAASTTAANVTSSGSNTPCCSGANMTSTPPSAQAANISSNNFLTYDNPTYGITMQYPLDWSKNATVDKTPHLTKIVEFDHPSSSGKGFIDNVIIFETDTNNRIHTLKELLSQSLDIIRSNQGYKILEANTNATLSNQPAYLLVSTFRGGTTLREIGTIIGDKEYTIQYYAKSADYSTYLPIVDKMIDSFSINATQNSR